MKQCLPALLRSWGGYISGKRICVNQHSYKSCRLYILPLLFQLQLTKHQMGSKTHPNSDRTICPTHGSMSYIPSLAKEIFFRFFTSVLKHIVEQSNKYAAECMGEHFQAWQPITVDELCAYFDFMILMGIVRQPSLGDYWKKDMIYHYMPVAERISWDRFYDLHRYLHFVDNSILSPPHTPGYNKLGKIAPIITMLRNQFARVWNPGKNISIDEAMTPFKGRSSLKQYMPIKPIKQGIKVWVIYGWC